MASSLLESLPAELLATTAQRLPTVKDLVCFSILVSRTISDKLGSHSGIQSLTFVENDGILWLSLVRRLYCLRRLEVRLSSWMPFTCDKLCDLSSRYLQVLRIRMFGAIPPFVRIASDPTQPGNTGMSLRYEAIHLDQLFPQLTDLTALALEWDPKHESLVEDFIEHLPRRLHTLDVGILPLSAKSMASLPPSLTSFGWRGMALKDTTLVDLPPEVRLGLLHFHWTVKGNGDDQVSNMIQTIPPSVTSFRLSGYPWTGALCESLPATLHVLDISPAIAARPQNGEEIYMEDRHFLLLPPNLTALKLMAKRQMPWTQSAYNSLPRTLTKLTLQHCVAPPSGGALPPNLRSFKAIGTVETSKGASLNNAPPSLRSLSFLGSALPDAMPSFTLPLTKMVLNAKCFPSDVYATFPRTLTHLDLQDAEKFFDAQISDLPTGLLTLLLTYPTSDDYPLTEEAFELLPRGLQKLDIGRLTITGALLSPDKRTWSSTVCLEQIHQRMPVACVHQMKALPVAELYGDDHLKRRGTKSSFSKLPPYVTDLTIDTTPAITFAELCRFTELVNLRLGRDCSSLHPPNERYWPSFAPKLSSLTIDWYGSPSQILHQLPRSITRVIFNNGNSYKYGVNKVTIPTSIKYLGMANYASSLAKSLKASANIETYEIHDNYNLQPITFTTIPEKITTFIFSTGDYIHQDISQFRSCSKLLTYLPATVTTVQLGGRAKINNLALKTVANLKHFTCGAVEIVDLPPLPADCTEIRVPSTVIEAFKVQHAHLKLEIQQFAVAWDAKFRPIWPPNLRSLHFQHKQAVVTKDFVASLPRGLQHLGMLDCDALETSVIPLLPPTLTSLNISGDKIYESALERLPATLTHLNIANCFHSVPELLPSSLRTLQLSCMSGCSAHFKHRFLTDAFITKLPRNLSSLIIDHRMQVTNEGLAGLPPGLESLRLMAPDLTLTCLDFLPDSVTAVKLPSSIASSDLRLFLAAQAARRAKIAQKSPVYQ